MTLRRYEARLFAGSTRWALPLAVALAVATVVRLGLDANGIGWAIVQVGLVAIAAGDLATRRIPNAVTLAGAVAALVARAIFHRSALVEVLATGVACLVVFLAIAIVTRGGLGMGDVKLAGLLGFLLGLAVVPALLVGTIAGAVAAATMVAVRRASLHSHIAYGPYLSLGGAVAILGFHPPVIL